MYISFYLDDEYYSGEAEAVEITLETVFYIDFADTLKFMVHMNDNGCWSSDQNISSSLIYAVGEEIERREDSFESQPASLKRYYSSGMQK